ncbi:MAG TPA: hypothetical protein PKN99_13670 [Cyclobacteriaceae bacterium]|nr:hypothetical protein [Cyclobacteriaceae bacterium]HNP08674.1 hypothetical protein [Cyclobacteriaceae bacterium]
MIIQRKKYIAIGITVALILLIPFIAMKLTNEVNWSLMDFIVAGGLLLTTGLVCEWVLRKVSSLFYRVIICLVILVLLLLVWAELAVGIFIQ